MFNFLKGAKKMAKQFLDDAEALIAKIAPHVEDADALKADVLAALQPHLDTIDEKIKETKSEADLNASDTDTVKSDIADLQQVIKDALQHLADGKPAEAQAALTSAIAQAPAPAPVPEPAPDSPAA